MNARWFGKVLSALSVLSITVSVTGPGQVGTVAAQQAVTSEDIVNALRPKPGVRSFRRGITVEEGAQQDGPPSIDLYVTFQYDSDALETDATIILDDLARALANPVLSGHRFTVAGHTDAKGDESYNQDLSERRAESVKRYLTQRASVDPARLQTKGYGESNLLDPSRPEDGVNRRVQIIAVE